MIELFSSKIITDWKKSLNAQSTTKYYLNVYFIEEPYANYKDVFYILLSLREIDENHSVINNYFQYFNFNERDIVIDNHIIHDSLNMKNYKSVELCILLEAILYTLSKQLGHLIKPNEIYELLINYLSSRNNCSFRLFQALENKEIQSIDDLFNSKDFEIIDKRKII